MFSIEVGYVDEAEAGVVVQDALAVLKHVGDMVHVPTLFPLCASTLEHASGQAVIEPDRSRRCEYRIYAVGPVWKAGGAQEKRELYDCYRKSLELAVQAQSESIAMPLISVDAGCPPLLSMDVAIQAVQDFMQAHDDVDIFLYVDQLVDRVDSKMYTELSDLILQTCSIDLYIDKLKATDELMMDLYIEDIEPDLEEKLSDTGETFSQMLLRLIDESGKSVVRVYKEANINRKLFSKIRTDIHYVPRKKNVLSFAVSLRLSLEQTEKLLAAAGYVLSPAIEEDIIYKYFIEHKYYDIYEIEKALFLCLRSHT